MRFFTFEWWWRAAELDAAGAALPATLYDEYFASIRTRLPRDVGLIAPQHVLHDSRLIRFEIPRHGDFDLVLRTSEDDGSGRLLLLRYAGVDQVRWIRHGGESREWLSDIGDLGYNEFDVGGSDESPLVRHSMLFWPGKELVITCKGISVEYRDADVE